MTNLRKPLILGKHRKALADKQTAEMAQQAEELVRMDKIVENSSEKNRNFFMAYLGLLIYVQAIIFSTTDLQLLVSTDGLKLPLVDLNVPLVGFYVVVPIFIIALHFNFLQNLDSHHYKLMQWQALHQDGVVERKFIYPFLFDYAILERGSQFQTLVKAANRLLCYNLAPITLGLLLIRFSDRQDWLVTIWHYFAFLFDCGLVRRFHRALHSNQQSQSQAEKKEDDKSIVKRFITIILSPFNTLISGSAFLLWGFWYGIRRIFGLLVLAETLLTLAVAATSDDYFVKHVQPWLQPVTQNGQFANFLFVLVPNRAEEIMQAFHNKIELALPRIKIDPNETVWHINRPELEDAAKLARYADWVKYFQEKGQGFLPETPNLRLINMPKQYLPRARLEKAKMQGSDLSGAQLQGANLNFAQLQGANLNFAQLQGANLSSVLHGAELVSAILQGADLAFAEMQGADLSDAQLQGADLSHANLYGTNFQSTHLTGSIVIISEFKYALNVPNSIVFDFNVIKETQIKIPIVKFFNDPNKNPDWDVLLHEASSIFQPAAKSRYQELIQAAKQQINFASGRQPALIHQLREIAKLAVPQVCSDDEIFNSAPVASTQAFRDSYHSEKFIFPNIRNVDYEYVLKDTDQNTDYQFVLKDIDRKLCTLPECADIRDKIDGLDCTPFQKEATRKMG